MAIDSNEPIRVSSVDRGGSIVLIRHGKDDGGFTNAGDIVVEDDGNLRLATPTEVLNYNVANEQDAARATAKAAGIELRDFPLITSINELNDYRSKLQTFLLLMFKEVFD